MLKSFFHELSVGLIMFANLIFVMYETHFVAAPYFVPCGLAITALVALVSSVCFMVLTTQIALYLFPRYMKGL